jgi:lysophospholipase L1-like esterase
LGLSGSGYKEKYATNQAFYQRVQTQIDADADVITIFGSGNDLHLTDGVPKYTIGNVDDVGTETICGCINTTLDWLQSNFPLTPLGIISMTPWASTSVPAVYQDEYVEKIAQICVKRGVPYLDLYHSSNLHPNSAQFKNVAYRRDGTYSLSAEGVDGAIQVTEDNVSIIRSFGVPNAQIGDWVLPNLTGVHPDEKGHEFFAPRIMSFLESLIMK